MFLRVITRVYHNGVSYTMFSVEYTMTRCCVRAHDEVKHVRCVAVKPNARIINVLVKQQKRSYNSRCPGSLSREKLKKQFTFTILIHGVLSVQWRIEMFRRANGISAALIGLAWATAALSDRISLCR